MKIVLGFENSSDVIRTVKCEHEGEQTMGGNSRPELPVPSLFAGSDMGRAAALLVTAYRDCDWPRLCKPFTGYRCIEKISKSKRNRQAGFLVYPTMDNACDSWWDIPAVHPATIHIASQKRNCMRIATSKHPTAPGSLKTGTRWHRALLHRQTVVKMLPHNRLSR